MRAKGPAGWRATRRGSMRVSRRLLWTLVVSLLFLLAGHGAVIYSVRDALRTGRVLFKEEPGAKASAATEHEPASSNDGTFAALDPPRPFEEIDAFDEDAKDWSNLFSHYMPGGLVFDANGDGRLDVYLCNDGQNFIRPTDANGVLLDAPRPQHNALYLNMGNDADGRPIFKQVSELV